MRHSSFSFLPRLAACLTVAASVSVATASSTAHLTKAVQLVTNMRAQGEKGLFAAPNGKLLNEYGAGWPNVMVSMGSPARTYARCSSFLTLMLMISYPGWTPQNAGFASASPNAAMYHDAIEANANGFKHITKMSNVKPGDILAVKYTDPDDDSGHAMIVKSLSAGQPDATGVVPWIVEIIDCSKSGHSFDTRNFALAGGGTYSSSGAGSGMMMIYTQNDKIVGYAWSLLNGSTVYTPDARHMTVGRFTA